MLLLEISFVAARLERQADEEQYLPEAPQVHIFIALVPELETDIHSSAREPRASSEKPRGEQTSVDTRHLGSGLPVAPDRPQAPRPADPVWSKDFSLRAEARNFQRRITEQALSKNKGNWAAARDQGMHRSNLHNLAARLGMR